MQSQEYSVHLRVSVCLSVRMNQNGWNYTITKRATWIAQHDFWLILGQQIKDQGHKGHEVQKHISFEGDRVAGVSLHSIEWSPFSFHWIYSQNVPRKRLLDSGLFH